MEAERNYFAYCLDTNIKRNYFIVPSKFLKSRQNETNSTPRDDCDTTGQEKRTAVSDFCQSAWHEFLEVDPDDGSFLNEELKTDRDFEHLLTGAEYKDCLVIDTASTIQELRHNIKADKLKVKNRKRRYDDSVASDSQQHDEPQQEKKPFRSSESNQQESSKDNSMFSQSLELKSVSARASPSDTPPEDTQIEMEEPIESHDDRGAAHIRPEGKANLGFFESEIDGRVTRQNADNVCVLVIHYEFKNNPDYFKIAVPHDVENLKTSFGKNRNCNFRNFRSPNKKTLLQLLGDDEKLLQFFNLQDNVPSVFVLFILSHGSENGIIWTDQFDRETNKYECFTTDEVLDSLQRLQRFDKCLKIVNFEPSRGCFDDSKYNMKNSYSYYANKNSCRITNRPGMNNYIVFYSTVETTTANSDELGSWFVRHICTCLNNANDEPLLKFFTTVQNRMHQASCYFTRFVQNIHLGQTPELKMFQQDKKFVISKTKIPEKPFTNTDGSGTERKVSNEILSRYFPWKSDVGQDIRGRRCFILSVKQIKQVQKMKRVLQNLHFEITDWTLSGTSMEFYFKKVSELEPDVGCIMTCIFGPVCENEEKEVCVSVQNGEEIPIADILHSLVGPKNDKLIGKPKIMFVVNVDESQTDNGRNISPKNDKLAQRDSTSEDMKGLQVSATNHSGWLVLVLKYKDALEKLIELFGNIGEKSLQELLEPLLTRESNREDAVLLNSTLQYLVKFPIWPRAFVKPDLLVKRAPRDQIDSSKMSTKFRIAEKINFDTLMKEAIRLFWENKKSLETQSRLENPKITSSIKSNPVRDFEAISATRDTIDASIVWLFNSVAGSGKSTVLVEMAHQLTQFDGGFKILLIPLEKYCRYLFYMSPLNVDEIEFLAKTTCNSHDDIKKWIKKREAIVFLDGFDQAWPEIRGKIIKILIALNNASVPLFIGSRPHEVHHIQEKIKNSTIVEIQPFDEASQIEFLQTMAAMNQQEIEELMKIFNDQDIMGNPLYLTLLAEYKGDGNLYDIFEKIVRRKVEICLVRENGGNIVGQEMIDKSLEFIQLVASRFVTGVKIDHGSVTKKHLEKMNAFGVVTYCNDTVNFTHLMFAEFLTAQKFITDLKNPGPEKVPLFNDELMQCRKFVDLFLSTEKGKDESYAVAFRDWAKSTEPLKLVSQICREDLRKMFKLLNPDLSVKDKDGKNALHFALHHLEMVKMVHEKKSILATEITNNGENCLHLAIADEKCNEEVAIWIMQNTEVDKNIETKSKDTPLLLAGARHKWELAKVLVFEYNVELKNCNLEGKSILHYAVRSNNLNFVQALLDRGSDVYLKDHEGDTALHIAFDCYANPEMKKMLLDKCAEVYEQDKRTALHLAARFNPDAQVVQKLLKNGADVNSKDQDGLTALHHAAWRNENPKIIKILLYHRANVNAKDNYEWTALHYAARFSPVSEVVQELLKKDAEIDAENDAGETALFLAAKHSLVKEEVVRILLKHGANRNDNKIKNDIDCETVLRQINNNP
ncbi:uncharacterized protein LOC135943092 [Cloeon dipterum]|uniref:uncharacterized protein LOC135943092 n=1 Tax=Cloeon dipterum TaxID=197152 RepID=UPI003220288A